MGDRLRRLGAGRRPEGALGEIRSRKPEEHSEEVDRFARALNDAEGSGELIGVVLGKSF